MIRALTSTEVCLARSIFGSGIDLDRVRLLALPWPFDRAFVPGRVLGRDWICWPARGLAPDMTLAPLAAQATLIHELVHVWQAQQGLNLLLGKLRAGDGVAAYRYPTDDSCDWCRLNIEQQAMMVEHLFRQTRGGAVPREREFYRLRIPFA